MSKRNLKEAFVQGHTGTTVGEVNIISAVPIFAALVCMLLHPGKIKKSNMRNFFSEFLLLVLPLVFTLMGPKNPSVIFGAFVFLACGLVAARKQPFFQAWTKKSNAITTGHALAIHLASIKLITCIAILAVDFHSFPRRFAKAEAYGTGFMDAGVGAIVVSAAFATSARAQHPRGTRADARDRFKRNVVRLAVLAALGFGRTIVTALLNYQTHVGEYGVHWNFFLTLAALRAVVMAVPKEVNRSAEALGVLGIGMLAAHQALISLGGMGEYMLGDTPRVNMLSANKEGIFSLPGYIALHFLGCAVGALFEETAAIRVTKRRQRLQVGALVAGLWAAFFLVSWKVEPVSRRSCNAAYVLWMLALNAQSLALLTLGMALVPARPLPWLLEAINDTRLFTFLAANVLTGIINLVMDTMAVDDWAARAVVAAYMAAVCAAAVLGQKVLRGSQRRHRNRNSVK